MSKLLSRIKLALKSYNADGRALELLADNETVEVVQKKTIEFRPRNQPATCGVVFYQGGRCDPRAYAPLLRPLAAAGCHVFVPQMALRMAVTGANKAAAVIASHPGITRWYIGGHSMGGVMAAAFASRHQSELQGLFMLGSYTAAGYAMPDTKLEVLQLHGSNDDLVNKKEMAAQPERLPAHTRYVTIDGGDHLQFGSFSNAEVTATIPRDEQQQQCVSALLAFLQPGPSR